MILTVQRTFPLKRPTPKMREVLLALGLQAQNLRHRTLFFIRNVVAGFEGGKLKDELHKNMEIAFDAAERHIARINEARTVRAKVKRKEPKLIGSIRSNPWVILNTTLLDNIVREEPDIAPSHPYKSVPAALAQGVIQQVYSDMQGYLKSLKAYKLAPSKFTGRPAMPGYGSDSAVSFEIPIANTNGRALPKLGKKSVARDIRCDEYLTNEQKSLWDSYELGKEIGSMLDHIPKGARAKSFRVTFNKGKPSFGVVFDIDIDIPDDSIMAQVYKEAYKKAGVRKTKFGTEVQKKPTEEMLVNALKNIGETRKAASLDFGITNLLSLVFADGSTGSIVAADRIARKLAHKNGKLDKWKSRNMPERLKELQAKRELEKLSYPEFREMKRLYKDFYSKPEYTAMTGALARWADDAFKKAASGAIKQLESRGIEALVVGLNKGWKTEVNMGSKVNRAFHGLAHSRIFGMLRSAGEKAGILVVSTEESHTSKTSFCNNTVLRKFGDKKDNREEKSENTEGAPARAKLPRSGNVMKENGGERGRKDRHVYRNEGNGKGKPSNWRKYVHADINGAFNILRKIFAWFTFNESLDLDYNLYWLSPKLGITPMRLL